MLKVRKLATALVLGLIMCLALFGTGAFAQSAHSDWNGGVGIASSTAIAGGFGGFGGLFGGFGGCGGLNWLSSFFGPDAVASSTAIGIGSGF